MTNLDNIIGDIVFISFRDIERYSELGINKKSGHYIIKGYDQLGIWVEHPNLLVLYNNVKNKEEKISADFIVTWDNINIIMHYPGRIGYDFPSEYDKKIGFKISKK